MTINHLNLTVTDVARVVTFFETYFEFNCSLIKGDKLIAILENKKNFVLVLMASTLNQKGNSTYPDAFHIGFILDTREAVDHLHQQLIEGGITIAQSPKKIRNSYGFYFYFDDLFIEVGHYFE